MCAIRATSVFLNTTYYKISSWPSYRLMQCNFIDITSARDSIAKTSSSFAQFFFKVRDLIFAKTTWTLRWSPVPLPRSESMPRHFYQRRISFESAEEYRDAGITRRTARGGLSLITNPGREWCSDVLASTTPSEFINERRKRAPERERIFVRWIRSAVPTVAPLTRTWQYEY